MVYNLTGLDKGNTFYEFVTAINVETNGYMATFILFLFFVLMIVVFKNYDTRAGVIAGSAITSLIAILFWAMGWIAFGIVFIPIGLLFAGLIWRGLTTE